MLFLKNMKTIICKCFLKNLNILKKKKKLTRYIAGKNNLDNVFFEGSIYA